MKKSFIWFALAAAIVQSSCESSGPMTPQVRFTASECQAIDEASRFFEIVGESASRSTDREVADITPLLRKANKRTASDTMAYIINYAADKGFAIVANGDCGEKVLAFSPTGAFDGENPAVKDMFVDRLEGFLSDKSSVNCVNSAPAKALSYHYYEPIVKYPIGQRAPYNQFVEELHPGCPAGCVPVACVTAMIYSRNKVVTGSGNYYLLSIRDGLENDRKGGMKSFGPHDSIPQTMDSITIVDWFPVFSRAKAQRETAMLLSDLGENYIDVEYTPTVSLASFGRAYNTMEALGFRMASNFECYNVEKVVSYIIGNCIVCMSGSNVVKGGGHAWVCDGCYYSLKSDGQFQDIYLHCDWGWDGYCNGFFNGGVFAAVEGSNEYHPQYYFAVERECKD